MRRFFLVSVLLILAFGPVSAQDGSWQNDGTNDDTTEDGTPPDSTAEDDTLGDFNDFDSLFEEDAIIEEIEEEPETTYVDEFLVSEDLTWGGSYTFSLGTNIWWKNWPSDYEEVQDLIDQTDEAVDLDLEASLYFDARPETDFRVFGKFKTFYPFINSAQPATEESVGFDITDLNIDSEIPVPNITLFELYSDFNIDEKLFFRVGKQVVNWGVGYFYSPADVLSLLPIDPEEPEEEREGPVSIKLQLPFNLHNLYLYTIANENLESIKDLAFAPKVEFVLGNYEIGLGMYYQRDLSPRGLLFLTGGIGDFDVFGEGVVSYGSDKTFVTDTPALGFPVSTELREEDLFFSYTVGVLYVQSDWDVTVAGQYYYNGEGYSDSELLIPAWLLLIGQTALEEAGTPVSPALSVSDLAFFGKHYAGLSVIWSEPLGTDTSMSLFGQANLSDFSGYIAPSFSYEPFERLRLTGSLTVRFGEEGDEFIGNDLILLNPFGRLSFFLGVTLGSGLF